MKKEKASHKDYSDSLSNEERVLLDNYFERLSQHIGLTHKFKNQILSDFKAAFNYYASIGVDVQTAAERLDPANLGGFYSRPPIIWYPLDDAAKIYPLSLSRNKMSIFRLSVYLKEEVVPELLEIALTFSIKRFPSFATTVKKGFFWHYLDASKRRFIVEPEREVPCHPMDVSVSGSQAFRMLYYKNRISVEFFHILTDGAGGLIFLKTVAAEYLRLLGVEIPYTDDVLDINETPPAEETRNDFPKAEPTEETSGFIESTAAQMSGRLSLIKPCQILHFEIESSELKDKAKERGASVTAYLLALMFVVQRYCTDELSGSVQIQVPVNMRKLYDSKTLRNFSLYCNIKLPLAEIKNINDILPEISRQLKVKASKEAMTEMMNATIRLVRLLRYVPLFIKRPVAGVVYGFLGDMVFSNTLSNLGVVTVPAEMAEHIEKFDFVLSAPVITRAACSMITFDKTAVLSVVKCTADPSFEEKLYALLKADGLNPRVKGSALYGS